MILFTFSPILWILKEQFIVINQWFKTKVNKKDVVFYFNQKIILNLLSLIS